MKVSANLSIYNIASGTIGGWYRSVTSATAHSGHIFTCNNGGVTTGLALLQSQTSNIFSADVWFPGGTFLFGFDGGTPLNNGVWRHLAFVFNGANGATNYVYVDGRLVNIAASPSAWSITSNTGPYWGGLGPAAGWDAVAAGYADWFFSSQRLSPFEIAALAYRSPLQGPASLSMGQRPFGIRGAISVWPLDGFLSPEPDYATRNGLNSVNITGTFPLGPGPTVPFSSDVFSPISIAVAPPPVVLMPQILW
jgi:hypothetical protein